MPWSVMNFTKSKKRGCTIGSPPLKARDGTCASFSCSSTRITCSKLSSSLKALPGPDSSMQCRQARLHSLVSCQATYSGAAMSLDSVVCSSLFADMAAPSRAHEQALLLERGQQLGDVRDQLAARVFEALFEARHDV